MALKFRLRGLAETFVDYICCPNCGTTGNDDQNFGTELTKVTFDGIIVVTECRACGEIFVPNSQRLGIIDPSALKVAVEKDCVETGDAILTTIQSVRLNAERLNAIRRGEMQ